MPPAPRNVATLVKKAADLLGEYMRNGRTRTDLLKRAAAVIVELRSQFALDDGRVDWSGRSHPYRKAIAAVYRGADIGADDLDTVQSALRYHIGNLLRERAEDEDLEAVGLTLTSPKQRIGRNRNIVAALAGSVGEATSDPIRLLTSADALLDYLTDEKVSELIGAQLVAATLAIESLEAQVARLRAALPVTSRS